MPATFELTSGNRFLKRALVSKEPYNATKPLVCKDEPVEIDPQCHHTDRSAIFDAWKHAAHDLPRLRPFNSANPRDQNSGRWFGLKGTQLGAIEQAYHNVYSLLCQDLRGQGARAKCMYDCNYFAYVYPSDSTFTIHLCNGFFGAKLTGKDSKYGTIVHESCHFAKVYGSEDYGYGCESAQRLAQTHPFRARKNSDNLEYDLEFSGVDDAVPSC